MARLKRLILSLLNLPPAPSPFLVRRRIVSKYLGGVFAALGMEFVVVDVVSVGFGEGGPFYLLYTALSLVSVTAGYLLYRRVPESQSSPPSSGKG